MAVEGMPILLQKDTTFTKLFVGGLPYHTTDATLHAFFLQYGDIEEAVVIHDRVTGKSKGYGFVTMADKEGAEKACANPNPMIDGRKANVNLAYLGAKPKLHGSQPGSPINISVLGRSDSPNALFGATQQSPPPFPLTLPPHSLFFPPPPQGYFDGPAPFSPPPMFPPLMFPQYLPPHFNQSMNYVPPSPQGFPGGQQQLPPLVPYNAAN